MDRILEVKGVNKSFKNFNLKDINFTLNKGYIMGFIGPNGAGKSTTIKLIMNLIKKDSGIIKVFGMDNINNEIEIKNRIGFVYDDYYFYEDLTINEMKRIISPFYSEWSNDTFYNYTNHFNLPLKKKIKDLSKGMKLKFSLALALSHNAELLIMDEPTSGLDPLIRNELLEILSDHIMDENKSVLFSTHIISDLDKIADYITFINQGEIILSDTKDDIIENYSIIKGGKGLIDDNLKKQFIGIKENDFGFEGLIKNKEILNTLPNEQIIIERPNLEDIMLYFVRGEQQKCLL